MQQITRKTPLGELVMNYPEAVNILFNYGFHCIGCGLSAYETIEEGAAAHGFDDAAIDRLVEELNEAAKKQQEMAKGRMQDRKAKQEAGKEAKAAQKGKGRAKRF